MKNLEQEDSFDMRQILSKYFYHWRYFVFSILFSFSIAISYLYFYKPVYEIKATLLIQDEKKSSDEKSTLQEIEFSNTPKLVENEIEVLKSRKLILQVINDLHLWTVYQIRDGYKKQDLYQESPVRFTLLKPIAELSGKELEIEIIDDNNFYLKNLGGEKLKHPFSGKYKNDFGTWKLEPTLHVNEYAGATIIITLNDPERVADAYQKKVEVNQLNKLAPIVGLVLNDDVEQRGKDILNTLIDIYNKETIAEKSRITQSTLSFIDQRLTSLSRELNIAEVQVESFRSNLGLTDISSQSKVYLENVQMNDLRLNEVNVQLNVIEGITDYVNASELSGNPPSILGISDPGLNSLIAQLSKLQLQKAELLATTPEDNPVFNPLNRQINSTRSAIKENISNIKSSLLNSKSELEAFNTRFEKSIRDIPGQERELISIKRQQSIKENLYIYLLQKREELSLSYAATLIDARVVDSAYAGPVQYPKRILILGIAIMLSFALPAGFIFAKDVMNNRIITREEIEAAVKAPVILELNFVKTKNPIVVLGKSQTAISEQFRTLRTHLSLLHGQKKTGRVTLITSSISGEGKSFVVCNLALVLAASGRKTIILDLDLRRPKISEIFKLPAENSGLSNYLIEEASVEEIKQPSVLHPKLDIIGSGAIPSNPADLLERSGINDLIEELKNGYDDIILDTPPLQLVTDALIVSHLSDVTLYLIKQGHTPNTLLPYIENLYEKRQFSEMNIIYNGIVAGKYGYGEDYGNGDYFQKNNNIFKIMR